MRNYSAGEQFEKLDIWTFWQFPCVIHNQFPNDDSWLTKGNSCSLNNHQYCETRTDPKLKPCTVQLSSGGLIKQIGSRASLCTLWLFTPGFATFFFTYKSICKLIIWTKIFAIDYTELTSSSERLGLPECMSCPEQSGHTQTKPLYQVCCQLIRCIINLICCFEIF